MDLFILLVVSGSTIYLLLGFANFVCTDNDIEKQKALKQIVYATIVWIIGFGTCVSL